MFGIEARERSSGDVLLEMRGEFDLSSFDELRGSLDTFANLRESATVDLSGVTFLDAGCARELAVLSQLHAHRINLTSPSWQTLRTIHDCGLGEWFDFRPAGRETPPVVSRAT